MNFILERFNHFPGNAQYEACTQGRVSEAGEHLGYTMEQPWKDNTPYHSCVPDGDYDLVPFDSPQFGPVFLMVNPSLNVYAFEEDCPDDTGRFLCLFAHVGNWVHDVEGCVALGEALGFDTHGYMVTRSADAIEAFRRRVPHTTGHALSIFSRGASM